jgi:hypothetical protein
MPTRLRSPISSTSTSSITVRVDVAHKPAPESTTANPQILLNMISAAASMTITAGPR